jgi:uncharacterized membrane protein YgdD (TMEM256/DUF423 family)
MEGGAGMNATARAFLVLGALNAVLAVALGAFAAHGLKPRLAPDSLAAFQTGVQYHFYHALGLAAVGLAALRLDPSPWLLFAGTAMAAGIVLFSGSLYALALTGVRGFGAVTPFGGSLFILAWFSFAIAIWRAH